MRGCWSFGPQKKTRLPWKSFSQKSATKIGTLPWILARLLGTKSGNMAYIPERGDAVWITFNPQAGHEQAGRRPAIVLSPSSYNSKVGLAILCPVTSQVKG